MENVKVKRIILAVLAVGVVGMTIAFAAFTQSLFIRNNEVRVSSNWRVRYAPTVTTSVGTTMEGTTTGASYTENTPIVENDRQTITGLRAVFTKPGDYVEVAFTVRNEGNIAAKGQQITIVLGDLSCAPGTGSGVTQGEADTFCNKLVKWVKHSDRTTNWTEADKLPAYSGTGEYPHIDGILRIEMPESLENADIAPLSKGSIVVTLGDTTLNFEQDDSGAGPDPTPGSYTTYEVGDIVYYDPVADNGCTSGSETCYKWRVIETADSSSKSQIKLQLDHNLIESEWGSSISGGPGTALTNLATATSTWTKVEALTYTYDSSSSSNNYGTLNCTNGICSVGGDVIAGSSDTPVRARLITNEELVSIKTLEETTSNCTFQSTDSYQYFTNIDYVSCQNFDSGNRSLGWLVENTTMNNHSGSTNNDYGSNNNGYFSLTPHGNYSDSAYAIYGEQGFTSSWGISNPDGIRPVVMANKDDVALGNDVPEENVIHTDTNTNPVYHPGDIVYFDPVTTSPCNSSTFDVTKAKQWQSFCFKFRVIETNDSADKTDVTLMLDHNLATAKFYADNDISRIAGLFNTANGPTSSWSRVPLLNYSYDIDINGHRMGHSYGTLSCTNGSCGVIINNKKITISGNSKVRLITPEELDALNVYAGGTSTYSKMYPGGGSNPIIPLNSSLSWLLENTTYYSESGSTNNEYGNNQYGYWTLTPIINQSYGNEYWSVYYTSGIKVSGNGIDGFGVRPVITVPKSYVTTD